MESFLVSSCLILQVGCDGCSILIRRRRRPLTRNNNKETNNKNCRDEQQDQQHTQQSNGLTHTNTHNNQVGGDGELSCFFLFDSTGRLRRMFNSYFLVSYGAADVQFLFVVVVL